MQRALVASLIDATRTEDAARLRAHLGAHARIKLNTIMPECIIERSFAGYSACTRRLHGLPSILVPKLISVLAFT